MLNGVLKKLGRRKAGSYGRPGSKRQKRAASKAARKETMRKLEQDFKETWFRPELDGGGWR